MTAGAIASPLHVPVTSTTYLQTYTVHLRPGTIYDYCQEHGYSRAQFARLTGLTDNTLYRADAGLSLPSTRFIAALMAATGLGFDHWFQLVECRLPTPPLART